MDFGNRQRYDSAVGGDTVDRTNYDTNNFVGKLVEAWKTGKPYSEHTSQPNPGAIKADRMKLIKK